MIAGFDPLVSGLFFYNEPSPAVIRVHLLGSRGLALAHLGGITERLK
jgi:hypothetical protein